MCDVFRMADVDWMQFFRTYAAASQARDAAGVAAFYADGFLVAGPTGASAFKNDESFHAWLSQLFEFNEQVGLEALDVANSEPSAIDGNYVLVAVDWLARFRKTGEEQIPFRISYIVGQLGEDMPKIVGYVSHEDQEDLMKARGLL